MNLPPIGTKAVHKEDYKKSQGPVYEVTDYVKRIEADGTPMPVLIGLEGAKHKLNTAPVKPRIVTPEDFQENYKSL